MAAEVLPPPYSTPDSAAPPSSLQLGPLVSSIEVQTAAAVTALVVQAHLRWKAACWDTADPASRKPGRYIVGLAFDATGKLTILGISELRDESDPSIAQCLRRQINDFKIPAPGYPVAYDVPFQMP